MAVNTESVEGWRNAFSDFTSDMARATNITSVIAESKSPPPSRLDLDFILNHFKEGFPRTISTKTSENRQILVYSKEEALARFKAANYLDCKINAYPSFVEWKGINRQAPNFIFIDLDEGRFKSRRNLDRILDKTCKNINEKFKDNVTPTILWSGHGYHIYLPVDAFVLEGEEEFNRFGNPSRKFIQFAEEFLSDEKAVSFKNCMIRIPGSFNSKNGTEEVKIIQKWNNYRPSIKPLLFRFDIYLLVSKSKELNKKHKSYEPRVFSSNWNKKR